MPRGCASGTNGRIEILKWEGEMGRFEGQNADARQEDKPQRLIDRIWL
jgi:hypothetical protein